MSQPILLNGDVEINREIISSVSETGRCGIGGMDSAGITGSVAGTDVNFRTKKTYTPSSITLTALSSNATPATINITKDGFWLYVSGTGTANTFKYWRGTYQA